MLTKRLALEVLNEALATGADYAELFYEDSNSSTISIENKKVDSANSNAINGVGLRLLKEKRCVYGYTSELTKSGLLKLARTLRASFNGERLITVSSFKEIKCENRNPIKRSYNDVSKEEIIALLRKGVDGIYSYNDPRIVRTIISFLFSHRGVVLYNSKGKWFHRETEFGRFIAQAIAANEKGFETGFEGPGTQDSIEYFSTKVDVYEAARNAARVAIQNLDAKECPSGVMPVVVGNGWGGVLFHESCGHPLEASSFAHDLSVFSGKTGEAIANSVVSAVDDSTMPNEWGSIDIDDEGNLGSKRQLIKDGILLDNMIDDFNGRSMGKEGNGACRRQDYRYNPTSRMSNTYIENGKSTKDEIIKATKLGLYTVGFNGGQVNPATGEFNFGCSEAYIIRDGKVCEPVKGAMLIGKSYEILKDIDMVANDLALGQGNCGAASGTIRTNVGQPTLRISKIMVGGRGGELK
ncbi:MAG: TldD/PmbA family protein [Gammaproteobacteria bacterium]|nr:TldD/PmbA family protein [Gammaproteobacteria bacterium]